MPDQKYKLTIDGRSYIYTGTDKTTPEELTGVSDSIRASKPHIQFVAGQKNAENIAALAKDLGIPQKAGITPAGKKGIVNDTGGLSTDQFLAQKSKLQAQDQQDEVEKIKRQNFQLMKEASERADAHPSLENVAAYNQAQKQSDVNQAKMQQLGGDRYDPSRLLTAAVSQPSTLLSGSVHDTALNAPAGQWGQLIEPGVDQYIKNDLHGAYGGLVDTAYGAADPFNLAMMVGLPFAGAGAKILSPLLLGQMAQGLGEQAGDSQLRQSDPGRYYGRLLSGLGLAALPIAAHAGLEAAGVPNTPMSTVVADAALGKGFPGINALRSGDINLSPGDLADSSSMQQAFSSENKYVPQSLYHGTNTPFDTFDPALAGSNKDAGLYGRGMYLTDQPGIAKLYGDTTLDVKQNFQNPYTWNEGMGHVATEAAGGSRLPPDIRADVLAEYERIKPPPAAENYGWDSAGTQDETTLNNTALAQAVTNVLQSRGHDSVIYDNPFAKGSQREYVALDPSKSLSIEKPVSPPVPRNPVAEQTQYYLDQADAAKSRLDTAGFDLVKQDAEGRQLFRNRDDPSQAVYRSLDGNTNNTAYKSASRMYNRDAVTAADPVQLSLPLDEKSIAHTQDGSEQGQPGLPLDAGVPDTINQNQPAPTPPVDVTNEGEGVTSDVPIDSLPKFKGNKGVEIAAQLRDKVNNFLVENLSAIRREAPASEGAIVKYSSAAQIASNEGRIRIPEVLKNFADQDEADQFQRYLTADAIDAKRGQLEETLKSAETKGDRRTIQSQLDNLAYQPEGGRLLDPVTNEPITSKMLDEYFQRPSVKAAVDAHKNVVEPFLNENFVNSGFETNGIRGLRSDTFTPKLAVDENGETIAPMRGNKLGTDTSIKRTPGAYEFSGTGADYEPDYQTAIQQRFDSGTRAVTQRQMIGQMLADGIAIDPAKEPAKIGFLDIDKDNGPTKMQQMFPKIFGDGQEMAPKGLKGKELTVNYNGVQEPAVQVKLGSGFNWGDGSNLDLPRDVVVPTRFAKEFQSVFETYNMDRLDRMANHINSSFIGASLMTPGELVAHTGSLTSRVGNKITLFKNPVADAAVKAIPFSKLVVAAKEVFGKQLPEDRVEATRYMAQNGILPKDFPVEYNPNASLAGKARTYLGQGLAGENGVLVKAGTALYQIAKENADLSTPEGQQLMRDMMKELNSGVKVLRPGIQRYLNAVGVGTFYQTGIKNRTSFFHQPPPNVVAGLIASIAAPIAAFKFSPANPEHKNPTDVPGYRLGDVPIRTGKDGKMQYFNYMKVGDKTASYATWLADSLLHSIANRDTAQHTALNAVADAGNQILSPTASGPIGNGLSALTGYAPHLGANDTLNGLKLTANNSNYTPLLSPQRALLVGQGMFPLSTLGVGDYGEQVAPTSLTPKETAVQALDRAFKFIGMPPLHEYEDAGKILSSNRQKENNARNLGQRSAAQWGRSMGW